MGLHTLSIRARIMLLAILPVLLISAALGLVAINAIQTQGDKEIEQIHEEMIAGKRAELKHYLDMATSSVDHLIRSGRASDRTEALAVWEKLRYGKTGYFYAYNTRGINVMHPIKPSLVGKDLSGLNDKKGNPIVRDLLRAAMQGDGYSTFWWARPDTGEIAEKMGMAVYIANWDLVLGTGFYIDDIDQKISAVQQRVSDDIRSSLIDIALVAIGSLLVLAMLSVSIANTILKPLRLTNDAMASIATGDADLTRRLDDSGNDELSVLAGNFNSFAASIQSMVQDLANTLADLQQVVTDVNHNAQATRTNADLQHEETTSVATAMEQMLAAAQEVAENAASGATSAQLGASQASDGERTLQAASQVIDGLSHKVENGAEVMSTLTREVADISSVLDVIRDIAEQTNLLALNAAIEAARAGDKGRGFAVVADEVRTLASRTQNSTQEIQQMIERLQQGTRDAVNVMQAIEQGGQTSVAESNRASEALAKASAAIQDISSLNTRIAAATEEQTATIETINRSLQSISQLADETRNQSGASADSGQHLERTGQHLKMLIERFRY